MLGVFWVIFGSLLAHFWVTCGSLLGALGVFGAPWVPRGILEDPWWVRGCAVESLGVPWGYLGGTLGVPWVTLGAPLGSLGGPLVSLGVPLELPWSSPGCVLD